MMTITDLENGQTVAVYKEPNDNERVVSDCMAYFEKLDNRHRLSKNVSMCGLTPFHTALCRGDKELVEQVLQNLSIRGLTEFVLNLRINHDESVASQYFRKSVGWENAYDVTSLGLDTSPQGWRKDGELCCKHSDHSLCFELPLALASLSGKTHLVQQLVKTGADVMLADSRGNNLVHCLVILSVTHCQLALSTYRCVTGLLSKDAERQKLVFARNADGYNPLELAADLVVPEILQAILSTDGVYRFSIGRCGIFDHNLYDLSHYEAKSSPKIDTSILFLLTCVTEKQMVRLEESGILSQEPLKSWIQAKFEAIRFPLLFWVTVWVGYVGLFGALISYYFVSQKQAPLLVNVFLFGLSVQILWIESYHLFLQRKKLVIAFRKMRRCQKPFLLTFIDHFVHLGFAFNMALFLSMHVAQVSCERFGQVLVGMQCLSAVFAMESILFLTKITSAAGHCVTLIQKTVTNVVFFTMAASIPFLCTSVNFYLAHQRPNCPSEERVLSNTTGPASQARFQTIWKSLYETMLLSTGISPPLDLFFSEAFFPALAIAIYAFSVLFLNIVVFNLIIAIMNQRVSELTPHKDTIVLLQKLYVFLFIEGKVNTKWGGLIRLISKLGQKVHVLYRGKSKIVFSADKTRAFLHTVEEKVGHQA